MTSNTARRGKIMTLLGECEAAGDGDREAVRSALRRKLFWHRNYDEKRPPAELDALLAPLEEAYDRLEPRSEEHTSELQSLMRISYAVFCLKKQKKQTRHNHKPINTTR